MSWSINARGTKDEVRAAVNAESQMPTPVRDYLLGAIDECDDAAIANGLVVRVYSFGHRPLTKGSTEHSEIRLTEPDATPD